MGLYLVTGAAGFIASAIARRMLADGHNIVTIDNLSTGIADNIPPKCDFIYGDASNPDTIKKLAPYNFDGILHFAGQSSGEVSFDNPVYDLQTNTQSTVLLLDYAKKVGCKKFIYASSMSVYGMVNGKDVVETDTLMPISFYAVGKQASENYLRIYSHYGIQCTALRFFNVYGPGQNMSNLRQGMVSIFLAMALQNRHITIKGSKERYRDFVYIDDVVDATVKSLNRLKGAPYEVYNVCSGKSYTVEEVVSRISGTLGGAITFDFVEGTPGDQFGIRGNFSKITADLSWTPQISFDEGLSKMIEWAKK